MAGKGRSQRPTLRAESVHSLQVQGRIVSVATADIQAATEQVLLLRCGSRLGARSAKIL